MKCRAIVLELSEFSMKQITESLTEIMITGRDTNALGTTSLGLDYDYQDIELKNASISDFLNTIQKEKE